MPSPQYQVIARKFRPQNFSEVRGQEHISKTLTRAIETGRIHHAYLFTGARGVGKTSMARILAKCLNCKDGPTATACGKCKSCMEITQGNSLDVREIDGASNTGVDDVRELREDVKYLPSAGKYRIYIIDEVHTLSTSAFNALLKTLEEPPAHVIFIFATTEPHKILETILSRCQRYDFRLLTQTQIVGQLEQICQKEKIEIEPAALHLIAQEAAGSLRDAETLLEQMIPFAEERITTDLVTTNLGLIDRAILREALGALVEHRSLELLNTVRNLHEYGHDLKHFVQDLLSHLRHLMVLQTCGSASHMDSVKNLLEMPDSEVSFLTDLAKKVTPQETHRLYRLLAQDFFEINHAPNQRFALEMSLLRMTQTPPLTDISQLIQELRSLGSQESTPSSRMVKPIATPAAGVVENPQPAYPTSLAVWDAVLEDLKSNAFMLGSLLRECRAIKCQAGELILGIPNDQFVQETLRDSANQDILRKIVQKITGAIPRIELRVQEDLEIPKPEHTKRFQETRELTEKLREHPVVKDFQKILGAEIADVKTIERNE